MFKTIAVASIFVTAVLATAVNSATIVPSLPRTGDAVFRATGTDPVPFTGYMGHAGIVSGSNVQDMRTLVNISGRPPSAGGLGVASLSAFKAAAPYMGARHKGQTPERGLLIDASVKSQRYAVFALTVGYKSPGVSFRSDGLLEWAYEVNGIDIVAGDTWSTLSPIAQFMAMSPR